MVADRGRLRTNVEGWKANGEVVLRDSNSRAPNRVICASTLWDAVLGGFVTPTMELLDATNVKIGAPRREMSIRKRGSQWGGERVLGFGDVHSLPSDGDSQGR